MALFSGLIETAYYINEDYTMIEVAYIDESGNRINHILEADPNHPDYQDLISEGYDEETLIDRTAEYKRAHSRTFNTLVNQQAKAMADEMMGLEELQNRKASLLSEVNKANMTKKELEEHNELQAKAGKTAYTSGSFDSILEGNSDKDLLFKTKLWSLELPVVKAASKDLKSKIRKSKRITEVLGFVDSLLK